MDYSPPASSVHEISQARILEWVAISFSRGSSQPRDWTCVSCTAGRFFTPEPPGKPWYVCMYVCMYIHTHTIKYSLPLKKNEILLPAKTWIHLKGIKLSEISQKQKSKYPFLSLLCGILKKRKKLNQSKHTPELTDSDNRNWCLPGVVAGGWANGSHCQLYNK